MADISYKYLDNEHRIDSYDNVVSTYDWIRNALMFVFESQNNLTLDCIIAFDSDSMSYECKSIDEFKKYAFGKTIRVKYMNVYVSENWVQAIISIYVSHSSKSEQQEFILSSENEMLVISLRDALLAKKKAILVYSHLPSSSTRITVSTLVMVIRFQIAPLPQRTLLRLNAKHPITPPKRGTWHRKVFGRFSCQL